jgi:hypothetical protein
VQLDAKQWSTDAARSAKAIGLGGWYADKFRLLRHTLLSLIDAARSQPEHDMHKPQAVFRCLQNICTVRRSPLAKDSSGREFTHAPRILAPTAFVKRESIRHGRHDLDQSHVVDGLLASQKIAAKKREVVSAALFVSSSQSGITELWTTWTWRCKTCQMSPLSFPWQHATCWIQRDRAAGPTRWEHIVAVLSTQEAIDRDADHNGHHIDD